MTEAIRPNARATMAEQIYRELRAAIWIGALGPGDKLVIDRLAKRFDVSITPVREAIRRLQLEGLVTDVPYRGVRVARASESELRELFAIRGVMEGFAIVSGLGKFSTSVIDELQHFVDRRLQVAVDTGDVRGYRRLNESLHERILDTAATGKLRTMVFGLIKDTERYRLMDVHLDKGYAATSQEQHRRLVELLRAQSRREIEELSRAHALMYVDHLARCAEDLT